MVHAIALCGVLALIGMATLGPTGIVAWSENRRMLELHHQQLRQLLAHRDQLRNRNRLLDPRHVDPDLAGELLRARLNVVHPDEMVLMLH